MVRNALLTALFVTIASQAAYADAPFARGAYLGGGGGPSIFDDNGGLGLLFNDEDKVLQVYGGYKFFPYFAVEARASDLGSYSLFFDTELDVSAVSVSAVGLIPFGESGWELMGHLGLARISQELSSSVDDSDVGTVGGIGVRWHVTPNVALGAQIDAYAWENSNLGISNTLSVGTQQFILQINFK